MEIWKIKRVSIPLLCVLIAHIFARGLTEQRSYSILTCVICFGCLRGGSAYNFRSFVRRCTCRPVRSITDTEFELLEMQLIKALESARGNGTSMISLIMPPKDQVCCTPVARTVTVHVWSTLVMPSGRTYLIHCGCFGNAPYPLLTMYTSCRYHECRRCWRMSLGLLQISSPGPTDRACSAPSPQRSRD